MTLNHRKLHLKKSLAAATVTGAVVLVVAVTLAVANRQAIAEAFTLATTHQTEAYTTLYFNNTNALPLNTTPGAHNHFSFYIGNNEAAPTTYTYLVTITANGKTDVLKQGWVRLAVGQGYTATASFDIPTQQTTATIRVSLPGRPNYISFRSES